MFKDSIYRKLQFIFQRHWMTAACIAITVTVLWVGAPAWAAPVARPLNQTVPRPTPTSEGSPVATATPQPDDDENSGSSDGGSGGVDNGVEVDPNAPNIVFPVGTDGSTDSNAGLTAVVTVNGLNLRDGPGTGFNTLGSLPVNTEVTVLSRNENGSWWYICCLPGTETQGWVSAQLLAPNFDAANASTLLSVFGTTAAAPSTPATPKAASQAQPKAAQPLEVDFAIAPYFVWQGITATLTITVNNPNGVDAVNVLLSDELPTGLTLVTAEANAGGTVEIAETPAGRPLLLFRWAKLAGDTGATATIVALVDADLADGAVIDNLVATRARNVAYSTSAVTIGLPPIVPPDFQ